jgi:hypothetical protein
MPVVSQRRAAGNGMRSRWRTFWNGLEEANANGDVNCARGARDVHRDACEYYGSPIAHRVPLLVEPATPGFKWSAAATKLTAGVCSLVPRLPMVEPQ